MTRHAMVIDISRCTACYCCFTACKDEHWENDFPPYSAAQPRFDQFWMDIKKKERGKYPYIKAAYMPTPCMQCQNAPCVAAAENDAVYRRPDGIVIIDPKKAAGQKQIVDACPYGAIYWNAEKNIPQKCSFCAHRIEQGKQPRCVQSCPSHAILFGDLDDKESDVAKLVQSGKAEVLHPDYHTAPAVAYIGLRQMDSLFVAGAVVFEDTDECAENVSVTLAGGPGPKTTKTNNYGNFEFDGLSAGDYKLTFEIAGRAKKSIDIALAEEKFISDIMI